MWNEITKAFANNTKVAFGDVNLSEEPIRGKYNPGQGGWPTIRYFNKDSGYDGKHYQQKTSGAVCDELKQREYMQAYIEEAGSTSLCNLAGEGCSDREKEYIEKQRKVDVSAELARLEGMKVKSMKPELMTWLDQRISILKLLSAAKEEL